MRYDNCNLVLTPYLIASMLLIPQNEKQNDYKLDANRIDIWQFNLESYPKIDNEVLNAQEKKRAARFYFERHRRRFTIARIFLRHVLASYLNEAPACLNFDFNKYGKPFIPGKNIEFNLSHSGDTALLAVGCQHSLGIDIEYFSARPFDGIAKELFSDIELNHFLALPLFLKPQAFFHVWAQKEAFIKACGLGLSYPTKEFSVPVLELKIERVRDNLHQQNWLLKSFMPSPLCHAALCYHENIKNINFFKVDS